MHVSIRVMQWVKQILQLRACADRLCRPRSHSLTAVGCSSEWNVCVVFPLEQRPQACEPSQGLTGACRHLRGLRLYVEADEAQRCYGISRAWHSGMYMYTSSSLAQSCRRAVNKTVAAKQVVKSEYAVDFTHFCDLLVVRVEGRTTLISCFV
jgi:hypothetical protein